MEHAPGAPYRISKAPQVLIGDGATWTRNWADQGFDPGEAVPILGHYHAVAYLHGFAGRTIKEERSKEPWLAEQGEPPLQGQVGQVIDNIGRRLAVQQAKSRVPTYCRAGRDHRVRGFGIGP